MTTKATDLLALWGKQKDHKRLFQGWFGKNPEDVVEIPAAKYNDLFLTWKQMTVFIYDHFFQAIHPMSSGFFFPLQGSITSEWLDNVFSNLKTHLLRIPYAYFVLYVYFHRYVNMVSIYFTGGVTEVVNGFNYSPKISAPGTPLPLPK